MTPIYVREGGQEKAYISLSPPRYVDMCPILYKQIASLCLRLSGLRDVVSLISANT